MSLVHDAENFLHSELYTFIHEQLMADAMFEVENVKPGDKDGAYAAAVGVQKVNAMMTLITDLAQSDRLEEISKEAARLYQ